ncbi:MAG: DNA-deoxyinosine glycosylase [Erysipelotrichales bacterium]|nr:DNA-deoxyinosine glycosylase [Erysipelotrichales bacterium]
MQRQCFEPIYDNNCNILILGSIPSVKSLENNFYYMHPRNQFWKILDAVFYDAQPTFTLLVENYRNNKSDKNREAIKQLLLTNNIALFDVINNCEGKGSLDINIDNKSINTNENEISKILQITNKVFLNGEKAYSLFIKMFPQLKEVAIKLPSTSPANTISFENKLEEWKKIKN